MKKKWEISEIEILPVKPQKRLVAFASCVLDGKLSLNDIAIHLRPNGEEYRLVYPVKFLPNGKIINLFYPITKEAGKELSDAIITYYLKFLEKVAKNEEERFKNKITRGE